MSLAVVACAASGGCTADPEAEAKAEAEAKVEPIGSIHPETEELRQAVLRWRQTAPPEEKAEIDEIIGRKDIFIHLITRSLAAQHAAGASGPATEDLQRRLCGKHLEVKGVPPLQNWDVIIDEELVRNYEEDHGTINPIEPVLHHEIRGHFFRVLRNPWLVEAVRRNPRIKAEDERRAAEEENRYRKYAKFPEVR